MGRAKNNGSATTGNTAGRRNETAVAAEVNADAFTPVLGTDRGQGAAAATPGPDPRDEVMPLVPPPPNDRVRLAPDAVKNLLDYLNEEHKFNEEGEDNYLALARSRGEAAALIAQAAFDISTFDGPVRPVVYAIEAGDEDAIVIAVDIRGAGFRLMGPYSWLGKDVMHELETGEELIENFLTTLTDLCNKIIDDFKYQTGSELPIR